MKDAIDAIKAVRAKRDLGIFASSYAFRNGELYVSDGRYAAGIPAPLIVGLDRLVPGDEIERLIARLGAEPKMESDDKSVTFRSGRMHGRIETSDPSVVTAMVVEESAWGPAPPNLLSAMKLARPFVADQAAQAYATCLCLRAGCVLATTNVSLIEVACLGLTTDQDMLLSAWAADFVLGADGDLTGISFTANYAAFRWSTGLWMRTQLVSGAMPTTFDKVLASIPEHPPVKIDPAWRKACEAVLGISEGVITIEPTRIVGGHGRSRVEHETEPCGVTGAVRFNPAFLAAVLGCADRWDTDAYAAGRPIGFRGPGVRGMIAGRRE